MKHDIHIDGCGFALRPIEVGDAPLIVALRSDAERTRFLHPIVATIPAQEAYLRSYLVHEGDYYFVVERRRDRLADGLVAIYDVDSAARTAEWGRWILRAGSMAGVESALMIYRVAFENLSLRTVVCRTFAENHPVVSFHDSAGLERSRQLAAYFNVDGQTYDAVEHVLRADRWPFVRSRLSRLIERLCRRTNVASGNDGRISR